MFLKDLEKEEVNGPMEPVASYHFLMCTFIIGSICIFKCFLKTWSDISKRTYI